MKPRTLLLTALVMISATVHPRVSAQGIAKPRLQPDDIPRGTQMGEGTGRYVAPVPAKNALPTLWLIGDSTVRNGSKGDNGPDGQWGWGGPIAAYFDLEKINIVNRAMGGTSSRNFYTGEWWQNTRPLIRKGDFVMIQFGANDNGGAKGKGALPGVSGETGMNGDETVHTFGWYLGRYVEETRAAGATPVICSLTPRKSWTDDRRFKRGGGHAEWAEQVAKDTRTLFVPLNEIIGARYEWLGERKVDRLYVPSPKENLHTGWDGAVVNAECVIAGLKGLRDDPFARFYSKRARTIKAWKP
ncbi:MAG: rhamnogalacturonan acetylesterase [Akkermansiaceae bacterium]|nr:rhamnogalacturonan acetylesterase [Akkermansiaceae bacterium]MCP5544147.1 rhamnogalacturonan acetylesterase [Akkermansiaceae bacterium]MCP5547797.1 rhamnogalacturonan acetylesterase [Akkermansiaceae bacterium]